jgi:hypothetical protein
MTNSEYYVITSRRGEYPERWSWEIRRRSTPLGVKLTADGFQSDAAARFAGKRALDEFLSELAKEEKRADR